MKKYLIDVLLGLKSLFVGMGVTFREFFKPTITEQYPHTAPDLPKRYRSHIELLRDEKTGISLCIACKSCEKACPSDCIFVDGIKKEGERRKSVTEFQLNFNQCSLCGACVEVCPTTALGYARDYNAASGSKEDFDMDLVKRYNKRYGIEEETGPPATGQEEEKAAGESADKGDKRPPQS